MIENPEYKGKWEQKKMPNPEYFHEPNPFHKLKPVDGVAFELVVNDPGLELDNVLLVGGLGLSPIEAARTKAGLKPPLATKNLLEDTGGLRRPPSALSMR